MIIEILHRYTGACLYRADLTDVREAVIQAVASGAYLSGADLSGAYLSGADLSGADLSRAYLSGANLSGAYLSGADVSGAYLSGADLSRAYLSGADLSGADLSRAYLSRADLSGADLSRANLSGANLSGADLSRAYLSRANLSRANLSRADLSGADLDDIVRGGWRTTPLMMLLDQPGSIRAYKLVTASGESPMQMSGKLTYRIGETVEVADANTDPRGPCAAGVNVATFDWCLREGEKLGQPFRVLTVEFTAQDIASIPLGTGGKFRLHRCRVVGEVNVGERATNVQAAKP